MSTLHTVNKSPFSHSALSSCLQACGADDSVLLLEDGVLGALTSSPCSDEINALINTGVKIYALCDDIKARGLTDKVDARIHRTDYQGFVELSIEHRCIQSWY